MRLRTSAKIIASVASRAIIIFIWPLSSKVKPTIAGVINKPTKFITLINGLIAGRMAASLRKILATASHTTTSREVKGAGWPSG